MEDSRRTKAAHLSAAGLRFGRLQVDDLPVGESVPVGFVPRPELAGQNRERGEKDHCQNREEEHPCTPAAPRSDQGDPDHDADDQDEQRNKSHAQAYRAVGSTGLAPGPSEG